MHILIYSKNRKKTQSNAQDIRMIILYRSSNSLFSWLYLLSASILVLKYTLQNVSSFSHWWHKVPDFLQKKYMSIHVFFRCFKVCLIVIGFFFQNMFNGSIYLLTTMMVLLVLIFCVSDTILSIWETVWGLSTVRLEDGSVILTDHVSLPF